MNAMPAGGDGPSGAIAVLKFPEELRSQSLLKTLVVQSNRMRHPRAYYLTPHFDFHFYNAESGRSCRRHFGWTISLPRSIFIPQVNVNSPALSGVNSTGVVL